MKDFHGACQPFLSKQKLIRLKQLISTPSKWTQEHIEEYEKCDQQMITGMLNAKLTPKKQRWQHGHQSFPRRSQRNLSGKLP
jgi:hypothetical protein